MIINTQKVIACQIVKEYDNYLEFDFWRCLPNELTNITNFSAAASMRQLLYVCVFM